MYVVKMSNHNSVLISENSNLEPGMLLGFSEFNNRIYFDGTMASTSSCGLQMVIRFGKRQIFLSALILQAN